MRLNGFAYCLYASIVNALGGDEGGFDREVRLPLGLVAK